MVTLVDGHLSNPRGICLDNDGRVFISDGGNNRMSVFKADGTFLYNITGSTADGSNINSPWGLAFDQCGNLHVAESSTSTIKLFIPQGQYITQYNSDVNQPAGIAIDDEGNIFITDYCYSYYRGGLVQNQQNCGHISQSIRFASSTLRIQLFIHLVLIRMSIYEVLPQLEVIKMLQLESLLIRKVLSTYAVSITTKFEKFSSDVKYC